MKKLQIGDLCADIPIIQGGMGVGVSMSGLASAVANAGGIGIISAVIPGFNEQDIFNNRNEANIRALRREIRKAREKTRGIIGINIMVAMCNYEEMVKTAIEENVDLIISGAGLPLNLPSFLRPDSKTRLLPIVSTDRAAELILRKWQKNYQYIPDGIVVESPLSGGHQGVKAEDIHNPEYSLEVQLPKILAFVKKAEAEFHKSIPVIVGGGIYTGAEIKRYQDMGAAGVQMATRFITTHECDADPKYKNAFLDARTPSDAIVIKSPVGLPLRILNNDFASRISNLEFKPDQCRYACLKTCKFNEVEFCIMQALINAQRGNLNEGVICSSINGYRNNKIVSVRELIDEIQYEYLNA
jgi:nitronate monooxygenase